jgi:hypothetical protein
MATLIEGGSFETFNDPSGNSLIALKRDGTISTTGVSFPDGTSFATAGSSPALTSIITGVVTSLQSLMQGTVALPGLTSVQVPFVTLGSGDNYVYTCPANTRAYMMFSIFNPTVGGLTFNVRISRDGGVTSYRDGNDVVVNAATATYCSTSLILEPGDQFNIHVTGPGLTGMGSAQQFSNTAKIKQVVFSAFVSGDNVVYTCPTGKNALIPMSENRGDFVDLNGQCFLSNETGGTPSLMLKVKPNGVGSSSQVAATVSTLANNSDTSMNGNNFSTVFNPGDQLIVNTNSSTAGQVFRCNVFEF